MYTFKNFWTHLHRAILTALLFCTANQVAFAQGVQLDIRNQHYIDNTFYFDIYLQRTSGEVHLGNADFVLDYNEANFNSPILGYVANTSELKNSIGTPLSYGNNIATTIGATGDNANRLIINLAGPSSIASQTQFDAIIARLDSQVLTHKLGTFQISNAINTNVSANLEWVTASFGAKTMVFTHQNTTPWKSTRIELLTANNPSLLTEPSIQASNIVVSNKTSSSITLSWTSGNGSKRILLVSKGNAVPNVSYPVDGIFYFADSVYGQGSRSGDSTAYVAYSGSGNSVTITGLASNTDYAFALFEFNGENGWNENYATSAPAEIAETTVGPFITAQVKVFLQGAYNTANGTMHTALRMGNSFGTANLLPSAQPYSSSPWNYNGAENVDTSSHPSNAVDWILVELRTTAAGSTVSNGQAAGFLLADGSIVDTNGLDPIRFWNLNPGYYFVVVKHRNHLPIMTRDSIYLNANSSLYDFTSGGQSKAYGTDTITYLKLPMNEISSGVFTMWAGDVNGNSELRYNLASNDRVLILSKIGGTNINASVTNQYLSEDINLNRQVRYNLSNNDRVILLQNIGSTNINARRLIQIP